MTEMWKLLYGAAKEIKCANFRNNPQFGLCVESLAKICIVGKIIKNRVTLQRIEAGKKKSIPYSEGEIRMACERKIEVRG